MKVVINKCYGGYCLSALAVKRLAELEGKSCYFFKDIERGNFKAISEVEAQEAGFGVSAFTIPNPNEYMNIEKDWKDLTDEERQAENRKYEEIELTFRPEDRANPNLIKVVEELGDKASSRYSALQVVEIPDGVEWEIQEYDGAERIAEKHRTWG